MGHRMIDIKCKLAYFTKPSIFLFILFLTASASFASLRNSNSGFTLILRAENFRNTDTIKLVYWDYYFSGSLNGITPHKEISVVSKNGIFEFRLLDVKSSFYFCLLQGEKSTIPNVSSNSALLGGPNEHLECKLENSTANFSGNNAEFYNMQLEIRRLENLMKKTWIIAPRANFNSTTFFSYFKSNVSFNQTVLQIKLAYLASFQSKFSPLLFNKLKADFIGKSNALQLENYFNHLSDLKSFKLFKSDSLKSSLRLALKDYLLYDALYPNKEITDSIGAESKEYIAYLFLKERVLFDSTLHTDMFSSIKSKYPGYLRDNLLSYSVMDTYAKGAIVADSLLNEALLLVKTKHCREILQNLGTTFSQGKVMHDFALPNENGKLIKLSNYKGKVVFIDFWFTGCSGCAKYYKDVLKPIKKTFMSNPNVAFISISIDKDKKTWKQSIVSDIYTSRDAINLFTAGKGIDHEVIWNYKVNSFPTIILIDKQGRLISNNGAELRNEKSLQKKLEAYLLE